MPTRRSGSRSNGFSDAISSANASGKLAQIAVAFIGPPGLAAGDQDFLDVTFLATGCGTVSMDVPVGKTDAQITDGSDPNNWGGNTVPVTTTGGSVTINNCSGGSGGGSQATQGDSGQAGATQAAGASQSTGGNDTSQGNGVAGSTQAPSSGGGDSANQGAAPNGGGGNVSASAPGSSAPFNNALPLWLPIVVAVPAIAVVWLGLRKWRLAEID